MFVVYLEFKVALQILKRLTKCYYGINYLEEYPTNVLLNLVKFS